MQKKKELLSQKSLYINQNTFSFDYKLYIIKKERNLPQNKIS